MGLEGGGGVGSEWALARLAASEAGVPGECVEAEACRGPGGLVYSIDGYSASEAKLPWITWEDWGWRAAAAAASDVVAAGGHPLAFLVSTGVGEPRRAVEIARGVGGLASSLGAVVLGGDTNRCGCDDWVDVAVVGREVRWVGRRGGRPGDLVVQAGYSGYGAVARAVLEGLSAPEELEGRLSLAIRRPGVHVGLLDVYVECPVKAAIDNSDGWAYTLSQLALASEVSIEAWDVLVDPEAERFLSSLVDDLEGWLLSSWEDYNVFIVVGPRDVDCVLDACRRAGLPCRVVGRLEEGRPGALKFRGRALEARGWDSFRQV